jgi:VWFA-related protein
VKNFTQRGRPPRQVSASGAILDAIKSSILNNFRLPKSLIAVSDGAYTADRACPQTHMPFTLIRSFVAVAALLAALAVLSSTPRAAQATREGVMFVSAVDREGEPVPNLGPDAFQIREDGVRREVVRVSRATEPIDIAILVDNSAAARDDVTFLRNGLSNFVAKIAPGNHVAVIALADRPTILVDYTDDTKRLTSAVGSIFAMTQSGMTLLDAIYETTRGLARRETPRAVIVPVFTDGVEFTNRYSKDIVKALQEQDVALHMVSIGQFYHSEEHSTRERSFLLDAGPRGSGGQRISLLSPHGLDDALQRLARELSSQYKVVYGRPEQLITPERAEVSSTRAGVTMRGTRARGESGA